MQQQQQQQQPAPPPPPVSPPPNDPAVTSLDFQRMLTQALQESGGFPSSDPGLAQAAASGIGQMLQGRMGGGATSSSLGDLDSVLQGMLQAAQQHQQPTQQVVQQQQQVQTQLPQVSQPSMDPFMAWATAAATGSASATPTIPSMNWQQNPTLATAMNPQATSNLVAALTEQVDPPSNKRQKRPYHHESFPAKLHRLLAETEAAERDDIVSFNAEGTAILIHQPEAFEEEIIPQYFRHSKLSSFKRQLSMYGFIRILDGPDIGGFTHTLFRKGQPDLSKDMERVS